MHIVGSPYLVSVIGGQVASPGAREDLSSVSFNLILTNKGTLPYSCSVLRAMEIPKKADIASGNGADPDASHCTRSGHTIAPGAKASVSLLLASVGHPPKEIVVLPYGSNVGRMVWTIADCPTSPKTCFRAAQNVQH